VVVRFHSDADALTLARHSIPPRVIPASFRLFGKYQSRAIGLICQGDEADFSLEPHESRDLNPGVLIFFWFRATPEETFVPAFCNAVDTTSFLIYGLDKHGITRGAQTGSPPGTRTPVRD
jgi:hypothetical protein